MNEDMFWKNYFHRCALLRAKMDVGPTLAPDTSAASQLAAGAGASGGSAASGGGGGGVSAEDAAAQSAEALEREVAAAEAEALEAEVTMIPPRNSNPDPKPNRNP